MGQQPIQRGLSPLKTSSRLTESLRPMTQLPQPWLFLEHSNLTRTSELIFCTETMLTTRSTSTPDPPTSLARMSHLNLLHPALPLMARCSLRSMPHGKSTDSG